MILCLLLLVAMANAQKTIHWMTFYDTEGCPGTADDKRIVQTHIIDGVSAALVAKGYTKKHYNYYGESLSPEACKNLINSMSISPQDIIVFYYSGHGGRPNVTDPDWINKHPFPQMCFGLGMQDQNRFISVEWLKGQLQSKGAQLVVILTDCCNSLTQGLLQRHVSYTSNNRGPETLSEGKAKNLQKLFLGYKGIVVATSSKPSQYSNGVDGYGGLYTGEMCKLFDMLEREVTNLSWETFLNTVEQNTDELSYELSQQNPNFSHQTPFHQTMLTEIPVEVDQPTTAPVQTVSPPVVPDFANQLANALSTLCNTSNSPESRISLQARISNSFAQDAVVKFLAQDSDDVIDKETSRRFLGRIATTRLVLGVNVVDYKTNPQNKITELKVREVYKR